MALPKGGELQKRRKDLVEESPSGPWGTKLLSKLYGPRKITIYSNGFIQINGNSAERLIAINGNSDMAIAKRGLGRAVGAVFTFGLNMWTPNLRGRMFLTIRTDEKTYAFNDVAEPHFLGVLQEIVTVGTSVIAPPALSIPPQLFVPPADALPENKVPASLEPENEKDGGLLQRLHALKSEGPSKTSQLRALKDSLERGEISASDYLVKKDELFGGPPLAEGPGDEPDSAGTVTVSKDLVEVAKLYESGLISESEFVELKRRILRG